MAWTWRFEKADGTEVAPAVEPEEFTTQGDAESWIGEEWRALLAGGADQAVLFDGDAKVYGPMSLHAETPGEADPEDPAGSGDAADAADTAGAGGGAAVSGAHLATDDVADAVAAPTVAAPDQPTDA